MTHDKIFKTKKDRLYYSLLGIMLCSIAIILSNIALAFDDEAVALRLLSVNSERAVGAPKAASAPRYILAQVSDHAGNTGRWRLVRTPGPEKGSEIVSVMRTADALKSDPDFAGLVIRCREKAGLQIALVVIRPFPPRNRPQVAINDGRTDVRFQASVLPSGSMLSLPDEAGVLIDGPWQSAKELSVDIEGDGAKIRGIVPLAGLSNAIDLLKANCRAP